MKAYTRKGVNVMADNRLYQRGQIMTWSLEEKQRFFAQHSIGMVINFWSKLDADMSECSIPYLYVPTPHSKDIMSINNILLAQYVSGWLVANEDKNVLVLCEAGRTRSVFFCVLLMSNFMDISPVKALGMVIQAIPGNSLKADMISYIKEIS